MTRQPSTIRASNQQTIGDPLPGDVPSSATARIVKYWREEVDASVLRTCEAFPSLASNRSLVLDLAVEEFKIRSGRRKIDPHNFCEQFQAFGNGLDKSVFRAIEVQEYLDCHPELMEFVVDFQWPEVGDSLQGFEVVEELGRGALARAYLCRDSGLAARQVVVKVARGDGYEAELLARLDHPNIVPIYSVINDGDRYVSYICMPFRGRNTLQQLVDSAARQLPLTDEAILDSAVGGSPLSRNLLAKRRVNRSYVDAIVRLTVKLCDALVHAHDVGVLHGDLKPSNVLLTSAGEPLLIDFNLGRDKRTDAEPRGGTLAYMPPELLMGLAEESSNQKCSYDVRSEVYSFGALSFQLLTGCVPFQAALDGDAPTVARQLLDRQLLESPSIRTINPTVNRGLEELVLHCLAIDPRNRPQSMAEVRQHLQNQDSLVSRILRWRLSRPFLSTTLVAAALIGMLSITAYLLLRPTYHVRQFQHGIALARNGDFQSAAVSFTHAMQDDLQRPSALFERGMTYLSSGEPSLAIADFSRCSSDYKDSRSTALIGYCLNLRSDHAGAIMWYERALTEGFENAALQNNLGISYAICKSHVGHLERYDRAVDHLRRALELDSDLDLARLNLVSLALIRTDHLNATDPNDTVNDIEMLLRKDCGNRRLLRIAVSVYGQLSSVDSQFVDRCAEVTRLAIEGGAGPTLAELSSSPSFSSLRGHRQFDELCSIATKFPPKDLATGSKRFLSPVAQSH